MAGGAGHRTNAGTMKTASRTLVMSPPEVWEQLDHPGRMQGMMCALVGHATEVEVTERKEEAELAWKAVPDDAVIKVEIAEKGWGTNVSVSADNGTAPTKLEGWLDAVLDELATPTKRPFEGMGEDSKPEPPAEAALVEAPVVEPPVEEPAPEEPPAEEPAPEEPDEEPSEPAPAVTAEKPKRKKRRRFFGF